MKLQAIIDAAVEFNLPPTEYFALWEDLARWQLDTLRGLGLDPRHRLLDIGCGAMRLGLGAVEYLDDGNYFGVDAFAPYLELARRLTGLSETQKKYALLLSQDFEFRRFGVFVSATVSCHRRWRDVGATFLRRGARRDERR